ATKAWQSIFYALDFRPGDRILTGHAEYASNVIAFLHMAKRTGATLEVIPDDETGQLDTDALRARMDERVRLVAMSHVPTQGGLVNPAEEVGEIVREWPAVYLLDACQSAGQLPLDVGRIRCDALSVTGRKYVRGPRGTGFLYTSAELRAGIEPAVLDLDSAIWTAPDEYRVHETGRMFESWERNLAATLGLGAAVDYALSWGIPAIARRVGALAQRLRDSLADIPGVAVHDQGRHKCGIVTFTVAGLSARAVTERLRAEQINTWVTPLGGTPSRFEGRGLPDLVRASLHYYNTEEEMAKLIAQATLLARENR
ncbi:MAG: aminotransferase class V-fold PLP-dependent enzyme, partial [Sciscionella sp.]|nr:aminotransferase class V-fold PLP-dependent enzyme [Sciscionella sp.]